MLLTSSLVSLPRNDNGTGLKERKGKMPALRYFNLIVLPSEESRSSGERPLIAVVQELHAAELMCLLPDEPQLEKCQI